MKKFIVFLSFVACFFSCHKQYETCEKECSIFTIKGRVLNMETNMGIANTPISVRWRSSGGFGFSGGSSKDIADGKTDNSGNFTFNTNIDTSLFKKYSIEVSIPTDNNNFLYIPSPFSTYSIIEVSSTQSKNFLFRVFPIAKLTLKINYPINNSTSECVSYGFAPNYGYTCCWNKSPNPSIRDTTLTVETASGILTNIKWYKKDAQGNVKVLTDSILCKKGVENVIKITY